MRSMILDLPYTGNVLNSTLQFHLKAINGPYPSYVEKRRRIQLWEKSYSGEIIHFILSLHPFILLSLNTLFIPQALPYLIENLIVSLIWAFLWWRIEVVEAQLEGT
jgi:hypothetical protein